MKTVNYPLEVAVQNVTYKNKEDLVESYKAVLESNKDFMRKCDYICYSITSINTSSLPRATYLIKVMSGENKVKTFKVITYWSFPRHS